MKTVRKPGLGTRLTLSSVGAIALVLAVLTVTFNVVLSGRLDHDANSVATARADAALSTVHVRGDRITLAEVPDKSALDSEIWIFGGRRILERPREGLANEHAAVVLARGPRRFQEIHRTSTRLYALPITSHGRRIGTVVAGVSLRPYEETERTVLIASVVLSLLALVAVGLVARWLISRALRPVARMTGQAAQWSDAELHRRFALGEPTTRSPSLRPRSTGCSTA